MQRLGTALVAVLAIVALAGAAGTFDAVEGPSITDDETPTGQSTVTDAPPPTNAPAGAGESSVRRAPTETPSGASGSGGVSPLVVPAVTGSALAGGLLVVFLTGNDERAPEAPAAGDSSNDDPVPTVDPDYGSPDERAIVTAWRRLRERTAGDETATPGEVAARALDRDLPAGPVSTVTDRFRRVRYGGDEPADDAVADAESAAEELDEASEWADDEPESTRTDDEHESTRTDDEHESTRTDDEHESTRTDGR